MKCKITRNAANFVKRELKRVDTDLKLRVHVTHAHGNHVHYGVKWDTPTAQDEVVMTDKEVEVILDKQDPWLDGIKIDYLYLPREGFVITNPSKGNHGDH